MGGSLLLIARSFARSAGWLLRIGASCFHVTASFAFGTRCSNPLKKASDRTVRINNGAAWSHDRPTALLHHAPRSFTRVACSFARAARLF